MNHWHVYEYSVDFLIVEFHGLIDDEKLREDLG